MFIIMININIVSSIKCSTYITLCIQVEITVLKFLDRMYIKHT